jgi:hypothetical protein
VFQQLSVDPIPCQEWKKTVADYYNKKPHYHSFSFSFSGIKPTKKLFNLVVNNSKKNKIK